MTTRQLLGVLALVAALLSFVAPVPHLLVVAVVLVAIGLIVG